MSDLFEKAVELFMSGGTRSSGLNLDGIDSDVENGIIHRRAFDIVSQRLSQHELPMISYEVNAANHLADIHEVNRELMNCWAFFYYHNASFHQIEHHMDSVTFSFVTGILLCVSGQICVVGDHISKILRDQTEAIKLRRESWFQNARRRSISAAELPKSPTAVFVWSSKDTINSLMDDALSEVKDLFEGELGFAMLEAEHPDNRSFLEEHDIQDFPTLLLMDEGECLDDSSYWFSGEDLRRFLVNDWLADEEECGRPFGEAKT